MNTVVVASLPTLTDVDALRALGLPECDARALAKIRQLRREKARGILILWDGPAQHFMRLQPDGRASE